MSRVARSTALARNAQANIVKRRVKSISAAVEDSGFCLRSVGNSRRY